MRWKGAEETVMVEERQESAMSRKSNKNVSGGREQSAVWNFMGRATENGLLDLAI